MKITRIFGMGYPPTMKTSPRSLGIATGPVHDIAPKSIMPLPAQILLHAPPVGTGGGGEHHASSLSELPDNQERVLPNGHQDLCAVPCLRPAISQEPRPIRWNVPQQRVLGGTSQRTNPL